MSKSEKSDTHELLVRLKHGQDEVIEILYPRYARVFYSYGRRHGLSHEAAEDAVQMIFDRILTRMATYNEVVGGGEGWMWQICSHIVTDVQRSRWQHVVPLDETIPTGSADGSPDERFQRYELSRCLEAAWSSISDVERNELQRAHGRGRHSHLWHQAIQRLRIAAEKCRELI